MADYYNDNAAAYFSATVGVDMTDLRNRFLSYIPQHGNILDAGCGSGRDTLAFLDAGRRVTAFDAAPRLVELASRHTGLPVEVMRFQDMTWCERFDGIWACASLLHVPRPELSEVFRRLARALKRGGVLYVSFKHGNQDREVGGRRFTDLDDAELVALLEEGAGLAIRDRWISSDRRAQRYHERWLNAILGRDG